MQWKKSSYSGGAGGNCVEMGVWRTASACYVTSCVEVTGASSAEELLKHGVRTEAAAHENVLAALREEEEIYVLRDSKDPEGPALAFTRDEWRVFIGGVMAGEFDLVRS